MVHLDHPGDRDRHLDDRLGRHLDDRLERHLDRHLEQLLRRWDAHRRRGG